MVGQSMILQLYTVTGSAGNKTGLLSMTKSVST